MKHGSLFSGIGGFDLAAEWMEWENIFHCEWNEFGQKVLKHYWPKAISYNDITKTDFFIHRGSIDILTGGFPCQPYSMAGKRKGKEDERHLWPEMLRAIREIQPSWVVGENVFGLVNWSNGLVFHEVQTDLETEGYEVFPYVLPAAAVNAAHRRDRIWFVAYSPSKSSERMRPKQREFSQSEQGQFRGNGCEVGYKQNATDTSNERPKQCGISRKISKTEGIPSEQRGEFRIPAKAICNGFKPDWENFPTQSPICGGDDGLPTELDGITFPKWRAESIKAYGNAIVPQVALQIFKSIEQYNQLKK